MTTGQSSESGVVGETALARRLRVLREVVEAEMAVKGAEARLAAAKAAVAEMEASEAAVAEPISEPEPVPFFGLEGGGQGPTMQSRRVFVADVPSDFLGDVVGYLRAFEVDGGASWKWSASFYVFGSHRGENLYDCTWEGGVRWLRAQHARFLGERGQVAELLAA